MCTFQSINNFGTFIAILMAGLGRLAFISTGFTGMCFLMLPNSTSGLLGNKCANLYKRRPTACFFLNWCNDRAPQDVTALPTNNLTEDDPILPHRTLKLSKGYISVRHVTSTLDAKLRRP